MPNDAVIQVRLDSKTKTKAARLFKKHGLSTSDGVRLLINQALQEKEIPHIPNAVTRKAITEARAGRGLETVTIDDIKRQWDEA